MTRNTVRNRCTLLDRSNTCRTMDVMTNMKRLLRRIDSYTLQVFNSPGTHARRRG